MRVSRLRRDGIAWRRGYGGVIPDHRRRRETDESIFPELSESEYTGRPYWNSIEIATVECERIRDFSHRPPTVAQSEQRRRESRQLPYVELIVGGIEGHDQRESERAACAARSGEDTTAR